MGVRFVCFIIIFFGASTLITGCGGENITDPEEEIAETQEIPIGKILLGTHFTIAPAPGAIIFSSQEFTLGFDYAVIEVTVDGISATNTGAGNVWIVSLILEPGTRSFSVEWASSDGYTGTKAVGPYTVVTDED